MLTLIFLSMLGGSGWFGARQLKRARRAEAQLRRIACTDDEVLAVLEASNSPMAERLLIAARSETSREMTTNQCKALLTDLKMQDGDVYRDALLRRYIEDGLMVTESQYLRLLKMFDSILYRDSVSRMLRKRRLERVKQG